MIDNLVFKKSVCVADILSTYNIQIFDYMAVISLMKFGSYYTLLIFKSKGWLSSSYRLTPQKLRTQQVSLKIIKIDYNSVIYQY